MIETPEPPHLPHDQGSAHKPGWLDRATTLMLLIISVCSLYVAWHTSHTMEGLVAENARLVRAQSTPILDYGTGNAIDTDRKLAAIVVNVGNGPARIAWSRFSLDDRRYATWEALATAVRPEFSSADNVITATLDGTLLQPGGERRLIAWPRPSDPKLAKTWDQLDDVRGRVKAEICYCSLFDECWLARFDGKAAAAVADCGQPPAITATRL